MCPTRDVPLARSPPQVRSEVSENGPKTTGTTTHDGCLPCPAAVATCPCVKIAPPCPCAAGVRFKRVAAQRDPGFQACPKVELHNHGDGSLTPQSLCELVARAGKKELLGLQKLLAGRWGPPPRDLDYDPKAPEQNDRISSKIADLDACAAELDPWVTSKATSSLAHFLEPFGTISTFLRLDGGATLMIQDFVARAARDNVIYSECRFAPEMLVPVADCKNKDDRTPEGNCKNKAAMKKIMVEAIDELKKQRIKKPDFRVKLIVSCIRNFALDECERQLDLAKELKDEFPDYMAGVDLAADEAGFPNIAPKNFAALFAKYPTLDVAVHKNY